MISVVVYYYLGGIAVIFTVLFLFRKRRKVKPPNSLQLCLRRQEMNVVATWVKSTSPNVVKQVLTWQWTDGEVFQVDLDPSVESHTIEGFPAPTHLSVFLTAHSAFKQSSVISAELDVPDISVPEAPTGLILTFNE